MYEAYVPLEAAPQKYLTSLGNFRKSQHTSYALGYAPTYATAFSLVMYALSYAPANTPAYAPAYSLVILLHIPSLMLLLVF